MMMLLKTLLSSFLLAHYSSIVQGTLASTTGGSDGGSDKKPSIPGEEWYVDVLSTLAGNYGNAYGDHMSKDHQVGATGSLENIGKFNLRLLSCDNILGAMSSPFPVILSPDGETSNINGYAKKELADRNSPLRFIPNFFNPKNLFNKYKGLAQRCEYAIYDATPDKTRPGKWTEKRRKTGTQTIKISVEVQEKIKDTEKANKELEENANLIGVEFCRYEKPKTDSKNNLKTGLQNPPVQKCVQHHARTVRPSIWEKYEVSTATMRRCSAWNDLCVEATVGTGMKPKFFFKVLPMRHVDLAPNAAAEFSNKIKYCEMLMFSFITEEESKTVGGEPAADNSKTAGATNTAAAASKKPGATNMAAGASKTPGATGTPADPLNEKVYNACMETDVPGNPKPANVSQLSF